MQGKYENQESRREEKPLRVRKKTMPSLTSVHPYIAGGEESLRELPLADRRKGVATGEAVVELYIWYGRAASQVSHSVQIALSRAVRDHRVRGYVW